MIKKQVFIIRFGGLNKSESMLVTKKRFTKNNQCKRTQCKCDTYLSFKILNKYLK